LNYIRQSMIFGVVKKHCYRCNWSWKAALNFCKIRFFFLIFRTISVSWPNGFRTKLVRRESDELWSVARASGTYCRTPSSITFTSM